MTNKIGQMAEKILINSICTIEIDNFTYYIFPTKEKPVRNYAIRGWKHCNVTLNYKKSMRF